MVIAFIGLFYAYIFIKYTSYFNIHNIFRCICESPTFLKFPQTSFNCTNPTFFNKVLFCKRPELRDG